MSKPASRSRYRYQAPRCVPCDKDLYMSLGQAQRVARRLEITRGEPLYVYRCPEDEEKYHLTRMEEHDDRGEVL